mmetsp:Transcript_9209/g.22590  ORF Transcript_9209/g.22590 Transcript_9209/m.22590 type:complete len:259 (-) Transcript_9209:429-1205(-)
MTLRYRKKLKQHDLQPRARVAGGGRTTGQCGRRPALSSSRGFVPSCVFFPSLFFLAAALLTVSVDAVLPVRCVSAVDDDAACDLLFWAGRLVLGEDEASTPGGTASASTPRRTAPAGVCGLRFSTFSCFLLLVDDCFSFVLRSSSSSTSSAPLPLFLVFVRRSTFEFGGIASACAAGVVILAAVGACSAFTIFVRTFSARPDLFLYFLFTSRFCFAPCTLLFRTAAVDAAPPGRRRESTFLASAFFSATEPFRFPFDC